ncbi:MAG TPA: hypothetical protein VIO32_08030 [Candidatus Baltobacteraceae bacterium]
MKQLRSALLTLVFAGAAIAGAHAAGMQTSSITNIHTWFGTWSCKSAGNNHTATFSPLFGGTAGRISENGKMPSEEMVFFDRKKHALIDEHLDASGAYNTMIGKVSGNTIHFTTVYPGPGPTLEVVRSSANTFSTTFTGTMNGKTMVQRETCTR